MKPDGGGWIFWHLAVENAKGFLEIQVYNGWRSMFPHEHRIVVVRMALVRLGQDVFHPLTIECTIVIHDKGLKEWKYFIRFVLFLDIVNVRSDPAPDAFAFDGHFAKTVHKLTARESSFLLNEEIVYCCWRVRLLFRDGGAIKSYHWNRHNRLDSIDCLFCNSFEFCFCVCAVLLACFFRSGFFFEHVIVIGEVARFVVGPSDYNT